ncbi:DUF4124 domain-containing protein [Psychrobacter sp. I-STPA10]|uniref:DUF4124 domain-containing protein n=1 Tax=Psychrobacter sp. I-STPA10 TaxID=2585769 RepID=UPI001E486CE6|nr:DUF4124 domain-containing protein [Psychrobacter sp. I-STPA10]
MSSSILPAANAVTIYKSVGAFGEQKYSQTPPQDATDVIVMELRPDGRTVDAGQMSGQTDANASTEQSELEQRNAELEAKLRAKEEQDLAQRCQNLRTNLTNLSTGERVYEKDDQGNRKYLDNREIELRRETVQKALQQYCSGQST